MGKTSNLKTFNSGGASSHAGTYGYSGYEDDYNRPDVVKAYATEEQEVTNPLDPYYENKRNALSAQKADDIAALDASRVQQRQEAAINNELLMKYLPQLNKASGLTGLGVAQSANVDALSRYQTNLGNIEKNYRRGVSEIERAYRADLAKIDADERTELIGDQSDAFGLAWEYIASGGATDRETLDRYLDGIEDTVSESQLAQLKALGDSIVSETEKQTDDTKTSFGTNVGQYVVPDVNGNAEMEAATNLDTVGSVVKVQGGGQTYALESNGIADDSVWQAANENNVTDGSVFLYDNGYDKGIYLKQNGRVYALSGTGGNYNTADYTSMYKYLSGAAPTIQQNTQSEPLTGTPNTTVRVNENKIMFYGSDGHLRIGTLNKLGFKPSTLDDGEISDKSSAVLTRIGEDYYSITQIIKSDSPNTEPNTEPKTEPNTTPSTTPSTTPATTPAETPAETPKDAASANANVRMIDFDDGTIEVTEKDGTKRYGYMTEVNASPTSNLYQGAKTKGIGVKFSYKGGVKSKANDYVKWDDGRIYKIVYTS